MNDGIGVAGVDASPASSPVLASSADEMVASSPGEALPAASPESSRVVPGELDPPEDDPPDGVEAEEVEVRVHRQRDGGQTRRGQMLGRLQAVDLLGRAERREDVVGAECRRSVGHRVGYCRGERGHGSSQ